MKESLYPKEIFLETHNLQNLNSGFGQFNFNLAKSLSHQTDFLNDHKIILNCNNEIVKKEIGKKLCYNNYIQITRYPFFRIKRKYNLWHSVNQNTKIEPSSNTIPYLLTVHDLNFLEEDCGKRLEFRINQFKEKLNRSSAIVYISEFTKKCTHEHFNVPNVPEYVIYNGNTLSCNSIKKLTDTNAFTPKRPFIFSIGQIVEEKNFHTLVEMIRFLDGINLVIAGELKSDYAEVIKKKIEKYNLKERVFLLGSISDAEKVVYYKNCFAFAFPSLREGFGLPVIEAMTFGKPVFLSNRTSLPEIGGEHSFYWNHFDPQYMAQVFSDGMSEFEAKKDVFTYSYTKRAKEFSWETAAKDYMTVYKSIL